MTLALIAFIVFFAVWGYQVLDRKAKRREYENKTRTDIQLQSEIENEWKTKLAPEIDIVLPENTSIFDYIRSLYRKYDIPIFSWIVEQEEKESWFQRTRAQWDADEKYYEDIRINTYNVMRRCSYKSQGLDEKAQQEYFSALDDVEINNRYQLYLRCIRNYHSNPFLATGKKFNSQQINEMITSSFIQAFGNDCPPLPPLPPEQLYTKNQTVRQRIFETNIEGVNLPHPNTKDGRPNNKTAGNFYLDLVYGLVKRDLYFKGYAASYTGKESEWQERAKKSQEFEKEKKKYPWLYN